MFYLPSLGCRSPRATSSLRRNVAVSLFALVAAAQSAWAVNYYVDPVNGVDTADGLTEATAVRTINRAAGRTNPGDTVYLRGGVHNRSPFGLPQFALVYVSRDGTPEAPITYTNYPGETPIVSTVGINGDKASSFGSAFHVNASWVIFRGLTIEGNTSVVSLDEVLAVENLLTSEIQAIDSNLARTRVQYGISLFRYSNKVGSNITIEDCIIRDCTGAGIAVSNDTDYVTIRNNTLYGNLTRNNQGTSAINLISLTGKVGAPANETRIIVEGNRVFNNENLLKWARDVTVTETVIDPVTGEEKKVTRTERRVSYSDGNGIIVDVSPNYTGRILIRNNLVYNNGGFGIALTKARNIDVFNNTTYRNGKGPGLSEQAAWGEISNTGDDATTLSNRIYNNIFWLRNGKNQTNGVVNATVAANNLFWRDSGTSLGARGPNTVIANPQFAQLPSSDTDPAGDFSIAPTSPAIDAGQLLALVPADYEGTARPQGAGQDIGAYEVSPAAPTNLTATVTSDTAITLAWTAALGNVASYAVEQADGSAWIEIASVPSTSTTYVATGLLPDTAYTFRIVARYTYSNTPPSASASARTLIRLDALVERDGLATYPYAPTEPGKQGTGLSLTSLGRIRVNGADVATVWRIRNASNLSRVATLAGQGVNFTNQLTLAAHTDTFTISPIVAGDATHRLVFNGITIDAKAASVGTYSDSRLVAAPLE